jgi:hypothetical protein
MPRSIKAIRKAAARNGRKKSKPLPPTVHSLDVIKERLIKEINVSINCDCGSNGCGDALVLLCDTDAGRKAGATDLGIKLSNLLIDCCDCRLRLRPEVIQFVDDYLKQKFPIAA